MVIESSGNEELLRSRNMGATLRFRVDLNLWGWLLLGVTTLSVEGWLPRRSERAKKVGEERGEARRVPVNASCGRTVAFGGKW